MEPTGSRLRRSGADSIQKKRIAVTAIIAALIAVGAVYFVYSSIISGSPTTNTSIEFMSINSPNRLLAPESFQNLTLVFIKGALPSGTYALSIAAASGLTAFASPASVNMTGDGAATDLFVGVAPGAHPGNYSVTVVARSGSEIVSQIFVFQVLSFLVQIFSDGVKPTNITVSAGSIVQWVNLDPGTDEINGTHTLQISGISVASPPLKTYAAWGYTFKTPGVYHYEDPIDTKVNGNVIVTA